MPIVPDVSYRYVYTRMLLHVCSIPDGYVKHVFAFVSLMVFLHNAGASFGGAGARRCLDFEAGVFILCRLLEGLAMQHNLTDGSCVCTGWICIDAVVTNPTAFTKS